MKEIERERTCISRKRKWSVDGSINFIRTMTTGKDRHKENGTTDPSVSGAKKPKDSSPVVKQENTIKFHDWNQTDTDVVITLSAGKQLKAKDIDATFTEQACKISLSDGRLYQCKLNQPISNTQSRVQCKGTRILARMKKAESGSWELLEFVPPPKPTVAHGKKKKSGNNKRPGIPPPPTPAAGDAPTDAPADAPVDVHVDAPVNGVMDTASAPPAVPPPPPPPPPLPVMSEQQKAAAEAKAEQKQEPESEEDLYMVDMIKHDFFEKSTVGAQDTLVLHLYLKQAQGVTVDFTSTSVKVTFQTPDPKYLSLNKDSTAETKFCWKFNTYDKIDPDRCRFQHTAHMIEITLRKILPRRWGVFEELKAGQNDEVQNWINNSNRKLEASTSSKSSTAVAFDEFAEERSRQDSNKLNNSQYQKPMCKVSPINNTGGPLYEPPAVVVTPGFTGLDNLGNTCFMNSVLQVLANTPDLRNYFLAGKFQQEINHDNPLGTGGQLAVAFATLLRILWSGKRTSYAPVNLKKLVAVKSSQFVGNAQHDAQEFLAFLLDGLHEDLNRVKVKPYTQTVESDGKPDYEVAAEAWGVHKQRNDSVIVDKFQGQYKSKLICPLCKKVSITFDPFMHLSVPLPKKLRYLPIIFMSKDPHRMPLKMVMKLPRDALVENLKDMVKQFTGVATKNLRVYEVYKNKVHKFFTRYEALSSVTQHDIIVVHEVLDVEMAGEPVYEILVSQRCEAPSQMPSKCSNIRCNKSCTDIILKRCLHCLHVAYCDQECQKTDWTTHKLMCRLAPEHIGYPFILSLPASQATYSRICQHADTVARYSVNVFQPPAADVSMEEDTESMSTSSTSLSSGGDSASLPVDTPPNVTTTSAALSCTLTAAAEALEKQSNEDGEQANGGGGGGDAIGSLFGNFEEEGEDVTDAKDVKEESPPPAALAPSIEEDKKTRVVMGRQQSAETPSHMFKLQPSDQYGNTRHYEPLSDRGDEPIPFPVTLSYVFIDWRNSGRRKPVVRVEGKPELEVEEHESVSEAAHGIEDQDITLEQCVELFTEPEVLSPEHAWYCPSCKAHREASKQLSIWSLPDILILHLKRFSFATIVWRDKIEKRVSFPLRGLDLSRFMTDAPVEPQLYDLYGVVNHFGSLMGGHYTSFTRGGLGGDNDISAGWRSCDDSSVTSISESRVVSKSAYVLFYQRRKPASMVERPFSAADILSSPPLNGEENGEDMEDPTAAAVEQARRLVTELQSSSSSHHRSDDVVQSLHTNVTAPLMLDIDTDTAEAGASSAPASVGPTTAMEETSGYDRLPTTNMLVNEVGSSGGDDGMTVPLQVDIGAASWEASAGDAPYTDMDAVD